jgi:hypothetical protein
MSKKRAGLPEGFELSVATIEESAGPVVLDDYLDTEMPEVRERPAEVEKKEPPQKQRQENGDGNQLPENVVAMPRSGRGEAASKTSSTQPETGPKVKKSRSIGRLERTPRKEISLDAESIRKIIQVRDDVRDQGPQPDASASELVRALVHLAHDVRHKAEYSHLSRRGQYGSATAKAFVDDLKLSFLRAVGQLYIERHTSDAERLISDLKSEPV